jgi:hypothetical protein
MVTMKQGDEYHLISKSGDWWEVIRDAGGANEFTFYVPASLNLKMGKSRST